MIRRRLGALTPAEEASVKKWAAMHEAWVPWVATGGILALAVWSAYRVEGGGRPRPVFRK